MSAIPRRCRIDKYTPAETAIRAALIAVEAVGAHTLLTDAVILLAKAQDKVADFVDGRAVGEIPAYHEAHPRPQAVSRDDAKDRLLMAMADVLHDLANGREYGPAMRANISGFQGELCDAAPQLRGRPKGIA